MPVRNEERDLAPSVRRLVGYLRESFPFTARITIADNGSTDATWAIASRLARELPRGAGHPHGAAGTRPGPAGHLVGERRRGPRLYGCRSVDRPERLAAAGGPAVVRAQRPGHRYPARPGIAGHPRAQAGAHLARLQHAAADPYGGALLGRAVRLQGHQAATRRERCCRCTQDDLDCARRHHRHCPGRPARAAASTRFRATGPSRSPSCAAPVPAALARTFRCRSPGSRSSGWQHGRLRGAVPAAARIMSAQAASLGTPGDAHTAADRPAHGHRRWLARLLFRHWVFGRPKRAPDAWHHQGTVHTSEMATQGERTN